MTSPHEQALAAAEVELSHVLSDFHYVMPENGMSRVLTAYLAALPAPDLADGLVVKPLAWTKHPAGGVQALAGGLGLYRVHANGEDWYLVPDHMGKGGKAAAQADYSRRILPAIDTSALSAKLAAVERERDAFATFHGDRTDLIVRATAAEARASSLAAELAALKETPMTDRKELVARAIYEARIGDGQNYYSWGDPCFYAEHPDDVDQIYCEAEAAIAALSEPVKVEPAAQWRVGEWGDGSTKPGEAVIVCDAHEAAVAAGVPSHLAKMIVEAHNDTVARPAGERPAVAVEAELEAQAWNCGKWPVWLHAIVSKTNEVADRLDMSSEQAHAFAALSALTAGPQAVPEGMVLVPRNEVERVTEIANRNEQSFEGDRLAVRLAAKGEREGGRDGHFSRN